MTAVDIIVPTYNRAAILRQTLESLQKQTRQDWRCWIAEDGETRETREAVEPFLQDRRFRYLPGRHGGIPAVSRNRSIGKGTAPCIAFADDDDLWLPEKLARQLEIMETNPDCVLLGSNALRWSGRRPWSRSLPVYSSRLPGGLISYDELVENNWIINSSAVIRRAALARAGLMNESPDLRAYEDYEFWLRIGALGEIRLLPEALVVYRDQPQESIRAQPDLVKHYQALARVFASALEGAGEIPSPLSLPENSGHAETCRRKRDYYQAGPSSPPLWIRAVKGLKSMLT
jgi:glycosyltransferase involved in cell wall biosynthesis